LPYYPDTLGSSRKGTGAAAAFYNYCYDPNYISTSNNVAIGKIGSFSSDLLLNKKEIAQDKVFYL
jgi:hypothetical protein